MSRQTSRAVLLALWAGGLELIELPVLKAILTVFNVLRREYHQESVSPNPELNKFSLPMDSFEAGFSLWGWWVFATGTTSILSLTLEILWCFAPSLASHVGWFRTPIAHAIMMLAGSLLPGAFVGASQWLVLQRRVTISKWWIVATSTGASLFFAIFVAAHFQTIFIVGAPVSTLINRLNLGLVSGLVLGILIGFSQWLILRRHSKRAGWWLAANIFAWIISCPLCFVVGQFSRSFFKSSFMDVVATLAIWPLTALLTGPVMALLVSNNSRTSPTSE
jgi:hypothetical protein